MEASNKSQDNMIYDIDMLRGREGSIVGAGESAWGYEQNDAKRGCLSETMVPLESPGLSDDNGIRIVEISLTRSCLLRDYQGERTCNVGGQRWHYQPSGHIKLSTSSDSERLVDLLCDFSLRSGRFYALWVVTRDVNHSSLANIAPRGWEINP